MGDPTRRGSVWADPRLVGSPYKISHHHRTDYDLLLLLGQLSNICLVIQFTINIFYMETLASNERHFLKPLFKLGVSSYCCYN